MHNFGDVAARRQRRQRVLSRGPSDTAFAWLSGYACPSRTSSCRRVRSPRSRAASCTASCTEAPVYIQPSRAACRAEKRSAASSAIVIRLRPPRHTQCTQIAPTFADAHDVGPTDLRASPRTPPTPDREDELPAQAQVRCCSAHPSRRGWLSVLKLHVIAMSFMTSI